MKLTDHFTLEELSFSETATRNGIDNTPPDVLFPRLLMLADGAERVRSVLGFAMRVHSGYRCEALEKIIARKDFIGWCRAHGKTEDDWPEYFAHKVHPKGGAMDFTSPSFGTPRQVVECIVAHQDVIRFDKVIEEGSWVHIQFSDKPRGQVLTARFGDDGVPVYTPGLA